QQDIAPLALEVNADMEDLAFRLAVLRQAASRMTDQRQGGPRLGSLLCYLNSSLP
ncbi:hypothetical protein TorRG33x02_170130, partial [Trema orientale]